MNKKLSGILMAAGLAVCGSVSAASVSYYMNESNKPSFFPSGSDYLQVTISDAISDDKIHFTVSPLSALTSITGSSIGIDKFMFNGPEIAQSNIDISGWKVSNNKPDPYMFGPFSNRLSNIGNGLSLFPLEFAIDAENDTIDSYAKPYGDGSIFFAARVGGFSIGGCNNQETASGCRHAERAYFAGSSLVPPSAIPVPAAAWLFVSGLLGMVGVSRRKCKL